MASGETIEITDRGRPVALLCPLPDGSPLERLRAAGEIEPAIGDLDDLPEPIHLGAGAELPSAIVTYDEQMAAAARQLGHRVASPR